jgi:hypothetical protein
MPAAQAVANAANVAALGAAGMGGAAGNFAPLAAAITAPAALPSSRGVNPYALSTASTFNPYLNFAARLGASANLGGLGFGYGGYGYPGYGYDPGLAGPGMGYGYALQGLSSYTSAAGKYLGDIERARITREQSRQMYLETQRRRIEFERWADSVRPTAPRVLAAQRAAELEVARKGPGEPEILSGHALNVLLRSIQEAGSLSRGPNVELAEDTLKHVNVTGGTSAGNAGLLKGGVKLAWPEGLQGDGFDTAGKRLTRNLKLAVDTLKDKEPLPEALLKDIKGDFKAMNDRLNESADELSPSQYIEARRFLNQLGAAIKVLSDPKVANYFNNTWNARGGNVAELVSHMTKAGLTFAPAAPGDEAAYRAVYNALRAFEAGLPGRQRDLETARE